MDKLFKIRRKSDGRFYKGKSKFTLNGTYYRFQQIEGNLEWVKSLHSNIELVSYNIEKDIIIDVSDYSLKDIMNILNREEKIDDILNNMTPKKHKLVC